MKVLEKYYLRGVKEPHKVKIYKTFDSEVKVVDDVKRTLVVKISTPTPDRSRDTVQPQGMQYDNFLKNPVVLFAHKYDTKPIAKCTGLKVSDAGVLATVEFPAEGVYQESDIIYTMYKEGFLNAWSIGFMPTDYEENSEGGYNFKSWELFEFSSVPVPDNPEALTVMRSKGIDVDAVIGKGEEAPEIEEPTEEEIEEEEEEEKGAEPEVVTMTVDLLKEIVKGVVDGETEKKDVAEVISLSYVLDYLHYFIRQFQQSGVSQDSIDKLQQALALVMEVTQMQAVLGEKSITLGEITVKSGRTISSKHEKMLKAAQDCMDKASAHVKSVLDSVAEDEEDDNDDPEEGEEDEKSGAQPLTKRLLQQISGAQKQLKETDKQVGLTLRLMKAIQSESKSAIKDIKPDGERS